MCDRLSLRCSQNAASVKSSRAVRSEFGTKRGKYRHYIARHYPIGPRLYQRSHACYTRTSHVVPRDRAPSQTVPPVSTHMQGCYNEIGKSGKKWLCVLFLVRLGGPRAVMCLTEKKTFAQINKIINVHGLVGSVPYVPEVRLEGYIDSVGSAPVFIRHFSQDAKVPFISSTPHCKGDLVDRRSRGAV